MLILPRILQNFLFLEEPYINFGVFLVAQTVKSLPAMQETQVWSLSGEDPLEKRMAQFSSVVQSYLKLCDPMHCSTSAFPVHHHLSELTQTHAHWVSDAIQPSHPLSSPSPPAFNVSQHQGLLKCLVLRIRWPKYWSFSFSISPSNEYSGLISFRMDWLDLLAVQGTHKNLLQHHSSKASILWDSAVFIVQLSHPHMTTGKIIA